MIEKRIKIRGVTFRFTNKPRKFLGHCLKDREKSFIYFPIKGVRKLDLSTIIHEFTHAFFWDLKEESVEEVDNFLSEHLWNIGLRKRKRKNDEEVVRFLEKDLMELIKVLLKWFFEDYKEVLVKEYAFELAELLWSLDWKMYRIK